MNLGAIVFYALAAVTLVSALLVVLHRNVLYSALSLIVTLVSLALIFVQLKAGFLAAIQVIVYAGAVMVLFVFVIMLLNLGEHRGRKVVGVPGKVLGTILLAVVFLSVYAAIRIPMTSEDFPEPPADLGSVASVGELLFSNYLLPFELAGVLLLSTILGAVVLARRKP